MVEGNGFKLFNHRYGEQSRCFSGQEQLLSKHHGLSPEALQGILGEETEEVSVLRSHSDPVSPRVDGQAVCRQNEPVTERAAEATEATSN